MSYLLSKAENDKAPLHSDELSHVVAETLTHYDEVKRALILHPDYTRNDFSDKLMPEIARQLAEEHGLTHLDTLNAAGTHRAMEPDELASKTGLSHLSCPSLRHAYNHRVERADELTEIDPIPKEFMRLKSGGHMESEVRLRLNRLLFEPYDLIISLSGTVPHEAVGYSGGTKIFLPGVSGNESTSAFHWAAVMVGIPDIIGKEHTPSREIVDYGVGQLFERLGSTPVLSFDMVYTEDEHHRAQPRGVYTGEGLSGFQDAYSEAVKLSSQLHIRRVDEPKEVVVQQLPEMYDDVWTGGKGSYKLQKPGVLAPGAEIILYAPHITSFHENKPDKVGNMGTAMDPLIRQIGYHGRDWVKQYMEEHPDFNRNVAAHVINVRGLGEFEDGVETFPFKVTLATQIDPDTCRDVGLGWRDPETLRPEDFEGQGRMWVPDGGQWLYDRTGMK